MALKIYIVTNTKQVSKKRTESKVIGFVSAFGWERPEAKAASKYPGFSNFQLHRKK